MWPDAEYPGLHRDINAAISAAVAAEREACAKAVEQAEHDGTHAQVIMRRQCAAAIRARNGAGRE